MSRQVPVDREARSARWVFRTVAVLAILLILVFVEASFGHDGLLCELGIDSDGAGMTTSGCGDFWRNRG